MVEDQTLQEPTEYGISVDIGSSRIVARLLNLRVNMIIDETSQPNPQNSISLDVISRLRYASKGRKESERCTAMLRESVSELVRLLLEPRGPGPLDVRSVVIVGNSVMQGMFFGIGLQELLTPPYLLSNKSEFCLAGAELRFDEFPATLFFSPPPIESFVGADAVAAILSSSEVIGTDCTLVLDIGVNTEIAFIEGNRIWVASAASGPAFEGMSIDCGMPAEPGAIDDVHVSRDLTPSVSVIGNGSPMGICGAGVIRVLDELVIAGVLNELGSFAIQQDSVWIGKESDATAYYLTSPIDRAFTDPIYISQIDIRMIQQSKAAIQAAILTLLSEAGAGPDKIKHVLVTGSFGQVLDIAAATRLGMMPAWPRAECVQRGSLALQGADMLHTDERKRAAARGISQKATYVELKDNPTFDIFYSKSMPFKPWTST